MKFSEEIFNNKPDFIVPVEPDDVEVSLDNGLEWFENKAAEVAHQITENAQYVGKKFRFIYERPRDKSVFKIDFYNSYEKEEGDDEAWFGLRPVDGSEVGDFDTVYDNHEVEDEEDDDIPFDEEDEDINFGESTDDETVGEDDVSEG